MMNVQQAKIEQSFLPTTLMGREGQLATFEAVLKNPQMGGSLVVSGPAGIGKTTLVKAFENFAREAGWRVVSDTLLKGLSERMRGTYLPALYESLTGQGSENFADETLLNQIDSLSCALQQEEQGLLITVDQVDKSTPENISELAHAIWVAQRKDLPVRWVIAGRTAEIRELLESSTMVEFGVLEQLELCAFTRSQTEEVMRRALESCAELNTESVSESLLARACLATQGHPCMVYLVAEAIRQRASGDLSEKQLVSGIASAQKKLGTLVLEPLLSKLSAGDRAFLKAMAEDECASKMSDISARLGKNPQYAGVYRNRLLESQMIRSTSYGKVTFVHPHLREYLRSMPAQSAEDSFNSF